MLHMYIHNRVDIMELLYPDRHPRIVDKTDVDVQPI
jgi:hypothetical protein